MGNLLGSNTGASALQRFITELTNFINTIVGPVFGVIGAVGIFFAIYLAWRLAAAEDDNKRKDAKKQLMWTIIAIIALFAFIALFQILGSILRSMTF